MPEASRTARLTVLGALLLLALAAEDLRRAFTLLHPGALVLILLVSGGLAVREIWRFLHARGLPPSRVATIIFSIAAAGLCTNALALHGRAAAESSGFENNEWSRLEQRASDLRDAFSALVKETSEP
ncbi:MAG TPA: hypothetical protein VNI57_04870, partial [Candidatus Saccharimonadales bacterium]|nr:hypothetical protein [Candidatus Saccharimonadales bacterium]